MYDTPAEKYLIIFFRLTMAWTFLYAASHQVFVPSFSVVGFLNHTKTFHDVFVIFTTPTTAPITTYLVEYGHLLIGLSLLIGLMVRVSASFGVLLMAIYWFAHMDWPFIENTNNFIVDYHVVYAGVLVYLIVKKAGHVWGLDGWAENLQIVRQYPRLKPLFARWSTFRLTDVRFWRRAQPVTATPLVVYRQGFRTPRSCGGVD